MEQTDELDLFSCLPEELAQKIFASLDVNSLLKSERVGKTWKSLMDSYLWKMKCKKNNFQEVEQNRHGYKKCCKRHIHWKGVFLYHHTLRKNWLTKPFTNPISAKKGVRMLSCNDNNIIEINSAYGTINIRNSYGKIFRTIHCYQEIIFAKLQDGHLLSMDEDKKLVLWTVDSIKEVWAIDCSKDFDIAIDFCNGKVAVNPKYPNFVHLMNIKSKKNLFRLKHACLVTHIKFYEDKLICACEDGTIKVWNHNDGKLIYELYDYDQKEIYDISMNGIYAVSRSSNNNAILIWDIHSGEKLHNIMGTMTKFLDKKTLVFVEENHKFLTLLDCNSGKCKRINNEEDVQKITANSKFIFTKSANSIKMYNIISKKLERSDATLCTPPKGALFFEASDTKLAVTFCGDKSRTSIILDFDVETC